jgi:hypothetical protein
MIISQDCGAKNQEISFTNVVFPHPLSHTKATFLPPDNSRENFSNTLFSQYEKEIF